jgi:hypothetical protein
MAKESATSVLAALIKTLPDNWNKPKLIESSLTMLLAKIPKDQSLKH